MAAAVGNQYAAKVKRWQKAIERALARYANENVDAGLDQAADVLVKAAIEEKQQWALKEIGDRIEGKAVQPIAGDDDSPAIQVKGIVDLVRPTY